MAANEAKKSIENTRPRWELGTCLWMAVWITTSKNCVPAPATAHITRTAGHGIAVARAKHANENSEIALTATSPGCLSRSEILLARGGSDQAAKSERRQGGSVPVEATAAFRGDEGQQHHPRPYRKEDVDQRHQLQEAQPAELEDNLQALESFLDHRRTLWHFLVRRARNDMSAGEQNGHRRHDERRSVDRQRRGGTELGDDDRTQSWTDELTD